MKAFELLRAAPPTGFLLASANEDDITRQLHYILEDRLLGSGEVEGFDRRRFKNVVRAPEVTNFDGIHPAKKPDLVLFLMKREHLSALQSQDGLFAECKPVDDNHAIGGHYCDRGIGRFVNGDYAWAMQDGMMIAYVRGGRTIRNDLASALGAERRRVALGSPSSPAVVTNSSAVAAVEALHSTTHRRSFDWPNGRGPACNIRVFHSWHICG